MEKNNKKGVAKGDSGNKGKLPTATGLFDCHSHIHLDKKKIEPFLVKCVEERQNKIYKTFYYEGLVLVAMEESEWGQVIHKNI